MKESLDVMKESLSEVSERISKVEQKLTNQNGRRKHLEELEDWVTMLEKRLWSIIVIFIIWMTLALAIIIFTTHRI